MAEDGILYDPSRNPFKLGTKKYLVADEIISLGRPLTPEDRDRIADKYKISKGTLSNVLTGLRKEGLYVDEYTRGEKLPPSKMGSGKTPKRASSVETRSISYDQPPARGDYITKDDLRELIDSIDRRLMGLEAKISNPNPTMIDPVPRTLPKELITRPRPPEPTPQVGDLATQAFQLFETGHTGVEVMQSLDLTYDRVVDLLKKFNEMKLEERKRERMWGDEYVTAWYKIAEHIGSTVRDKCDYYRDTTGICGLWEVKEIGSDFRKKFPGVVKTSGRKVRLMVGEHPEICALCRGGGSE